MAFKVQYVTNNIIRRQGNLIYDDEEINRVVTAFDEANRLWDIVEMRCAEEVEQNQGDIRISLLNRVLVIVIFLKENFNIMRDCMQNVEDGIRCFQYCCAI